MPKRIWFVVLAILLAQSLFAQRMEPHFRREAVGEKNYPPAPQIARQAAAEPLISLASAESVVPEAIDAIHAWNASGREPLRNGFLRAVPGAVAVQLSSKMSKSGGTMRTGGGIVKSTATGSIIWSGAIRVENALRLRLHLTGVSVPPGTVFWVYGANEEPIAFDTDLLDPNGALYTPITEGDVVYLEVESPAAASDAVFSISDVVQIVRPFAGPEAEQKLRTLASSPDSSCLVDATCVTSSTLDVIASYRKAVAQLQYMVGADGYVCTGGLLNDDAVDGTPYLLTANHCFSTQTSASSLQAFFDYKTATCGGNFPAISSMPRANGATLLATSANSDVTLVRLNSVPANRAYLGWDPQASSLKSGVVLHRIAHPFPDSFSQPAPQVYSYRLVNTSVQTCTGRDRPNYIYSTGGESGTFPGSSGSPVIMAGGYVVGQLFGLCGLDPTAGCDNTQGTVDGAFSASWPLLQPYLRPGSGATPTPTVCTPSATTACVLNNRFQVKVRYRGAFDNNAADTDAQVKSVSGMAAPAYETAFFYFNSASNIEMMIKMLDQGNTNSAGQPTIALLYGSATPLRIEMTIVDTQKGVTKTYTSEFNTQKGGTDFTAFVK